MNILHPFAKLIQIVFNNKQKLVSYIILFVKKDGYDREPWKVKFVGITYSGLKFMFFFKKKVNVIYV